MVKERFIILRTVKYSEADLIVQAISRSGEKKSFIARGAFRSKKRFGGGVLEPSHYVEFSYKENSHVEKLNVLGEAQLLSDFKGIRNSYEKLDFALKVLDCVSRVSLEGDQTSEFLFNLLGHTLKSLEESENLHVLQIQFYLKFLLQQGVIQKEDWMLPFLQTKISDNNHLASLGGGLEGKLSLMENVVHQYVRQAVVD